MKKEVVVGVDLDMLGDSSQSEGAMTDIFEELERSGRMDEVLASATERNRGMLGIKRSSLDSKSDLQAELVRAERMIKALAIVANGVGNEISLRVWAMISSRETGVPVEEIKKNLVEFEPACLRR